MPKKINKAKDPAKVKAGQARAKKAIRIGGRFTTNEFTETVKSDATEAGAKDPFKYFLQNEKHYENIYTKFQPSTSVSYDKLKKQIITYKGKFYDQDNNRISREDAIKQVVEFNQYLATEQHVKFWWTRPQITLSGKMKIAVPDIAAIKQRLKTGKKDQGTDHGSGGGGSDHGGGDDYDDGGDDYPDYGGDDGGDDYDTGGDYDGGDYAGEAETIEDILEDEYPDFDFGMYVSE